MYSLNILVIDDDDRLPTEIEQALQRVGLPVRIEARRPVKDASDRLLGMSGLQSWDLNHFDLAFVDLELKGLFEGPRDGSGYDPTDLQGGSDILPHLRQEAPWLPVIGYSQLLNHNTNPSVLSAMSIAAGFGFDGLVSRLWFTRTSHEAQRLTYERWQGILERARKLRLDSVIGATGDQQAPDILIDPSFAAKLDSAGSEWKPIISSLFWFARSVTLEPMDDGHSSATVIKVATKSEGVFGRQHGSWVAKISPLRSALWAECKAHQKVVRGGLKFAAGPSLLWDGVVSSGRWAGIAYQTVANSQEAVAFARTMGLTGALTRIGRALESFYVAPTLERLPLSSALFDSLPGRERVIAAAQKIKNWKLGQALLQNSAGNFSLELSSTANILTTYLHGDLHLRNVLLGDLDVIIDFALAKPGPLVYDLARIVCDSLVCFPAELGAVRSISLLDPVIKRMIEALVGGKDWLGGENAALMELFIQACFAQVWTYESTSQKVKKRIAELLANSVLKG